MRNLFFISFFTLGFFAMSQTVSPQVLNSAGKHYAVGVNGVYFSDNVGEPFVATNTSGNVMVTEGFLQPFAINARINGDFQRSDVSCVGKRDGVITVSVNCNIPNSKIQYCWNPVSLCPDSSCASIDSLDAGVYSVKVRVSYTIGAVSKTDTSYSYTTVIQDMKYPCKITAYNAVSMNNDGVNDVFYIENITEFPNSKVYIFNRWGQRVFYSEKYDNAKNAWPEKGDDKLLSSTYFYIIDLGDGSAAIKGWVELIRN